MAEKTPIERVAQAIWELGAGPSYEWARTEEEEREHARGYARAAIAAMREPSEVMLEAADPVFHETWKRSRESSVSRHGKEAHASATFSELIWHAMIDAALSAPAENGGE